jgi:hypothetical protein
MTVFRNPTQDRCEILESDTKVTKKKPASTSYWNIFKDWRRVYLKEPPIRMSEWEILERKKNAQNAGRKIREASLLDQEDYFESWRRNLVPKKRPMKLRRRLEPEDYMMIWSQVSDLVNSFGPWFTDRT